MSAVYVCLNLGAREDDGPEGEGSGDIVRMSAVYVCLNLAPDKMAVQMDK
jgi:hypothetical protein